MGIHRHIGLLVLFVAHATFGTDPPRPVREQGMGGGTVHTSDLGASIGNQAGLAAITDIRAGLYHQRHWLAHDLVTQGALIATRIGKGPHSIGLQAMHFGNGLYRLQRHGMVWAMELGEGLRAGIGIEHVGLRLPDAYGRQSVVAASVGLQARLTPELWLGAHIHNINGAGTPAMYRFRDPTLLRLGLAYSLDDRVQWNAEAEQDLDHTMRFRSGVEYRPGTALQLRLGCATAPFQMAAGAGLRIGALQFDLAVTAQARMGIAPMAGLQYRWP